MKIKREKTKKGWKVTLEYEGTVCQIEHKNLKDAFHKAFVFMKSVIVKPEDIESDK